jgi:ABC-type dipeptide/oligopeptide/nickel transport system permease subunit
MVRASTAAELRKDYSVAARSFGASRSRILAEEVLPNITGTLQVQATLLLAYSLLLEVGLSFVGVGVQPPEASWGTLLQDGYQNLISSATYVIFPGVAICITVLALNLLADARRGSRDWAPR